MIFTDNLPEEQLQHSQMCYEHTMCVVSTTNKAMV